MCEKKVKPRQSKLSLDVNYSKKVQAFTFICSYKEIECRHANQGYSQLVRNSNELCCNMPKLKTLLIGDS